MRNRYVLLLDVLLIVLAAFGAFLLRFDWFFLSSRQEFLPFLAVALLIKPGIFMAFGFYGRYWLYATVSDLLAVAFGVTAASIALGLLVGAAVMTQALPEFSRSVLLIDWLLTMAAAGGVRFAIRLLGERRLIRTGKDSGPRRSLLVVGAGAAGSAVLREIQRNPALGLRPVGLLDDDRVKRGKWIHGVRVLGGLDDVAAVLARHDVQDVIIAMPTAPGPVIRRVAQTCAAAGVASRTVPGMFELLDGRVSVNRLRDVEISDLLRRPEILGPVDTAVYVTGRTVLVTGAGGSIGLELSRQVAHARPGRLVLLGHGENSLFEAHHQLLRLFHDIAPVTVVADVRDRHRIHQVFQHYRPEIVFHAAAHKHVPLMEQNPEEAITNNLLGTAHVVAAALDAGTATFVLISTDKAAEPRNMMGASKRVAEQIVAQAARQWGRQFAVVRFGNVLGSRGSVVPHFKRQIEAGGPVTITHPEVTRFFMTIPEAVHLVLQAGGMAKGGELFVLNMGRPVRIIELAQDLIALSGYAPDEIDIVFTGLRPGEKIEERLWDTGAAVNPTEHPGILRVTEPASESSRPVPLDRFADAARRGSRLEIEVLLAEQVSTYIPLREMERSAAADR
jgi:FlaA1/EpsC-like NDP-sugar epimerase